MPIRIVGIGLLIWLLALAGSAAGDTEGSAFLYVQSSLTDGTSYRGDHYAKCIPGNDRGTTGRTLIYKVGRERDQLEDTYDWYCGSVYPVSTHDGTYVIRFAGGFRGSEPRDEDLAVAFYARGKMIRSYSARDLANGPGSVTTSVSHYQWCRQVVGVGWLTSEKAKVLKFGFTVETVDRRQLCFDLKTGELLEGWRPERLEN